MFAPGSGESLHIDGRIDQVDFEWGRGHRRSSVAAEYFRSFPFVVRHPCRQAVLARRLWRLSRDRLPDYRLCNGQSNSRNYRLSSGRYCFFLLTCRSLRSQQLSHRWLGGDGRIFTLCRFIRRCSRTDRATVHRHPWRRPDVAARRAIFLCKIVQYWTAALFAPA